MPFQKHYCQETGRTKYTLTETAIKTELINNAWEARSAEFPKAVGYGDTEKGAVENLVVGLAANFIDDELGTEKPIRPV